MDEDNQMPTQEEDSSGAAETLKDPDPGADQTTAPARPRRPQRSARVEGSVDISEPKVESQPEPKAESKPVPKVESKPEPKAESKAEPKPKPVPGGVQDEVTPDGGVQSCPKSPRPAPVKSTGAPLAAPGIKAFPKGHGHQPIDQSRLSPRPGRQQAHPVSPEPPGSEGPVCGGNG